MNDKINWKCERCHGPAEGRDSWMSLGWDNHWEVIGKGCLTPEEEETSSRYDIELHRLATIEDFRWWTTHLRRKQWYFDTDWPMILEPTP